MAKLDVSLDVGDAHELAEQAGRKLAATTQEVVAEGRKRLGRRAKNRARKLEQRVTEAAKRLPHRTDPKLTSLEYAKEDFALLRRLHVMHPAMERIQKDLGF